MDFLKVLRRHTVNNVDVTGAGDTVISVFSLVYTKTKNVIESVKIANASMPSL